MTPYPKLIRAGALFGVAALAAVSCNSPTIDKTPRIYNSRMTPVLDCEIGMAEFLNQFKPRAGATYRIGDPLPQDEQHPPTSFATAKFVVEGDEFVMEVEAFGLPPAESVTDPQASMQSGEIKFGNIWDVWLIATSPTVIQLQLGTLIADTSTTTGRHTLRVDSRTTRDFFGNKISVSSVTSVETASPNEAVTLFDISVVSIDIENLEQQAPEFYSGQLRLSDFAPFGGAINWARPTFEGNQPGEGS